MLTIGQGVCFSQSHLQQASQILTLSASYRPTVMVGFEVFEEDPFHIQFMIEQGEERLSIEDRKSLYQRLIQYFLASLTTPNQEMWVNLSPFEADRMIPESFSKTSMGRDFLLQDYVLKQLTASILHPQHEYGKKFWEKVYHDIYEYYGSVDIPVDVFNKVWIIPDKASVYQQDGKTLIVESRLKVMLETDYLAMSKNALPIGGHTPEGGVSPSGLPSNSGLNVKAPQVSTDSQTSDSQSIAQQVLREIVIPVLEKEVNEGAHFAVLRQMYQSMLLATWFKKALKEYELTSLYVDRSKTKGIEVEDKGIYQEIYERYVQSYEKGVFDIVQQDLSVDENIPKKYFAGGLHSYDEKMIDRIDSIKDGSMLDRSVDVVDVHLKPEENFYTYIKQYIEKLQQALPLIKSDGTYFIEPILKNYSSDEIIIQLNVIFKDEKGKEHTFYSVMTFVPDGKNVLDVNVFVKDSQDFDGLVLPQGEGIATWLYQELVKAMPQGAVLEEYITNTQTRGFLAERCFLDQDKAFFKDDQGAIKEVVLKEAEPNQVSIQDILQQTLMGKLLLKAGLKELRLRLGGYGFNEDQEVIYDLKALKDLLRNASFQKEDVSDHEFFGVESFTIEANKQDFAEMLSDEEKEWIQQRAYDYVKGFEQALPLKMYDREYYFDAFSRPSLLKEGLQEVMVGVFYKDHRGKKKNLGVMLSFTVGVKAIFNIDTNVSKSYLPEGKGFAKYAHQVLAKLTFDQETMTMHVINKETREFLAQRCFVSDQGDIFFRDKDDKLKRIVEQNVEKDDQIHLADVLKHTKVGALVLKQEGMSFIEMSVIPEGKDETVLKGLEALRFLLTYRYHIDLIDYIVFKIGHIMFPFIKNPQENLPKITPSFHLHIVKNHSQSLKQETVFNPQEGSLSQQDSFDKGGIDFGLEHIDMESTQKDYFKKGSLFQPSLYHQDIDGLKISIMDIKSVVLHEIFLHR